MNQVLLLFLATAVSQPVLPGCPERACLQEVCLQPPELRNLRGWLVTLHTMGSNQWVSAQH
jgi:hypothetical protein